MSRIQVSEQDVVALALQLSAQAISSQTMYMDRLSHFDNVIGEAIRLKEQIMLDIRSEQVKQSTFSVINKLIGENTQLQRKITTLEHRLVQMVDQVSSVKKLNSKFAHLQEELKVYIQKSEDVKGLQGIVGAIRYQIKELLADKGKTQEEVSVDEGGVLTKERDQLGVLKRAIQSRAEEFDVSWRVVKELLDSVERRGVVQDQTIQSLFKITRREIEPGLEYVESIRSLSQEQQQLLSNYQKQVLELQSTNRSWQRQMGVVVAKLKEEQQRRLDQIRLVEEGSLRESQCRIKIEVLQIRLREVTDSCLEFQSQKLVEKSQNKELVEGLSSLKQQNNRVMEQLYLVKEERTKMSLQIDVLRCQNSVLVGKLEEMERIKERNSIEHQTTTVQSIQLEQEDDSNSLVGQNLHQQIPLHSPNNAALDEQVAHLRRLNQSIRAQNQRIQCLYHQQLRRQPRPNQLGINKNGQEGEDPILQSLHNLNQLISLVTFYC